MGILRGGTTIGGHLAIHQGNVSTDETLAGNSDTEIPTEKAVKTYVDDSIIAAAGVSEDDVIVMAIALG